MRTVLPLLAVLMFAPAARADSILDYGWGMADARVPVGEGHFNIWVHPREDRFLIEPGLKTVLGGGGHYPDTTWRIVANAFVAPLGCEIPEIRPLSRAGAAWQARFACPPGVDLHVIAKAERADLKRGAPLRLLTDSDGPKLEKSNGPVNPN